MIITVTSNPNVGSNGNFPTVRGNLKGLCKLGCLNLSLITDRLTSAKTISMPNTEILATSEILPEYIIIVDKVKAMINIVANHGVLLEEWISASMVGIASSCFAIPKIILDPDINIIKTVLVVANNASMVKMIMPLFPSALDAAIASGALDFDNSSHPTRDTVEMATRMYIIVVTNMENIKALGIVLVGSLVSSAMFEIFWNP